MRGATEIQQIPPNLTIFQPTRPLRGATVKLWHWIVRRNISTHAPLAGRDVLCECNPSAIIGNFNPRAPCGARLRDAAERQGVSVFQPTRPLRGATTSSTNCSAAQRFQPTRPLRGATVRPSPSKSINQFQPTRPLRGATVPGIVTAVVWENISTHAPLAGRDVYDADLQQVHLAFQPTRPLRGATSLRRTHARQLCISTHAPLAGRDADRRGCGLCSRDFNPRAPCGARHCLYQPGHRIQIISPPAPLAGRDDGLFVGGVCPDGFQPTRPLRGATASFYCNTNWCKFQPTRPLRGATQQADHAGQTADISTHAPLAGRD